MKRTWTEEAAREIARRERLPYGPSAFGGWYVGTRIELERIGVPARDLITHHLEPAK